MRPLSFATGLVLGSVVVFASPVAAQGPAGERAVSVLVVEAGQEAEPVSGALVRMEGADRAVVTDREGRARLMAPAPGIRRMTASRLGYRTQTRSVVVDRERGASVRFSLEVEPLRLAEIRVPGERMREGKLADFFRREARAPGHFITPDDIAQRRPSRFTDLLQTVPGLRVNCGFGGCEVASARSAIAGRRCPMQFYLDGMRVFNMSPSEIAAPDVLAVEVYRGAAEIPAEFNRGTAMCGVIVVWTQEPGVRHGR